MKKVLLAMLGVLTALPAFAHDFSFSYKGQTLTYTVVDDAAKTCKVGQNSTVTGAVEVPATAMDGDVAYTVTAVTDEAFFGCKTITSISLPAAMRSIGINAFSRCSLLESVTLPDSLGRIEPRTFEQCTSLRSIAIPGKVSSIGGHAFEGCTALTAANIPSGITAIEESTFDGCYSLVNVELPGGLRTIGNAAFRQCRKLNMLSIGNSVNSIGENAFENCIGINTLLLGNGLASIGNSAFADCRSLGRIFCGEGLTTPPLCGADAFMNVSTSECKVLVPATAMTVYSQAKGWKEFANYLPNAGRKFVFAHEGQNLTYTVIDEYLKTCKVGMGGASQGNSVSGTVIIPAVANDGTSEYAVVGIDNDAFRGHGQMTSVRIPESVTWVGDRAFSNCNGLRSITFPNSINFLGFEVLRDSKNLSSITLPEGIKELPANMCWSCNALTSITIPNSVQIIRGAAFRFSSLTSITLPNSVKQLCFEAFSDTPLSSVKLSENLEIIEGLVFRNTQLASIYIPKNVQRMDTYDAAFGGILGSGSMKKIDVAEDNPIFCSVDGVLFNKSKSKLIRFPEAKADRYIIPDETEVIGRNSFSCNSYLSSITIPSSVISIEGNAFQNCTGLISVVVPASVKVLERCTFNDCSNLVSLTLPGTMTHINDVAIAGTKLSSLTLPESLVYVGKAAFGSNRYLTEISLPDKVTTIDDDAFANCSGLAQITIPKSVTRIGVNVFNECSSLARIDVAPENTAYCTVDGALYDFNKETLVCLPGAFSGEYLVPKTLNLTNKSMFDNYANITGFRVEEGHPTASAADGVLFNLNKTSLLRYPRGKVGSDYTIPSTVVTIDDNAFKGCGNLNTVKISNSVTTIGNSVFNWCVNLDSVLIPSSVTMVGYELFDHCYNLKKADLPNSVTTVGPNTYNCCYNLVSATVPNKLTEIPIQMFAQTYSLRSLTIPKSVKRIGGNAFLEIRMRELKFESEVPPETPGDPVYYWGGADNCTLIVPTGAVEAYRNSPFWGRFKNINDESAYINWSVKDINARVGDPIELSVAMSNPTPVSSFQCDIHLPEGIRPVLDEDGGLVLTLNPNRKARAHVIDGAVQTDGTVRIIAYSSNNSLFKLNEGELFSMEIESNDAQPGIYEVTIDNIIGVNQNDKQLDLASVKGRIELRPRQVMGDVNNDEVVNSTDVSCTVSHILGNTPEGFVTETADVNLDGRINVTDVNCIARIILGGTEASAASAPQRSASMRIAPPSAENGYLYLESFFLEPGEVADMPVRLNAPRRYCGFQTDIYLPEGVEVEMVDEDGEVFPDVWLNPARATSSHTFSAAVQPNGALRVLAYSTRLASFKNSPDNILFYVRVRATETFNPVPQPVWFRNTLFNDYVNNKVGEYYFVDNNPYINVDGVMGSTDVEVATDAVYYNLQGLRVSEPQRGKTYICVRGGKAEKIVF